MEVEPLPTGADAAGRVVQSPGMEAWGAFSEAVCFASSGRGAGPDRSAISLPNEIAAPGRPAAHASVSKKFSAAGVFLIVDHYYEPLINFSLLNHPLEDPRNPPGIDLNVSEQLEILRRMNFHDELKVLMAGQQKDSAAERVYVADNGFLTPETQSTGTT